MNVMWYVGKFDEATWHLFNALGLSPSYLRDAQRGMAAVEQQITYAREVHTGAVVSITSTVLEIKERSITFTHEMVNDETGEVVAKTSLKAVHLDTVARKACSISPQVIAAAQSHLATD